MDGYVVTDSAMILVGHTVTEDVCQHRWAVSEGVWAPERLGAYVRDVRSFVEKATM